MLLFFFVGLETVATFPVIFEALAEKGWSDEDLGKVAGNNLLRVLRKTEQVSMELKKSTKPLDNLLNVKDFIIPVVNNTCRVGLLESIDPRNSTSEL